MREDPLSIWNFGDTKERIRHFVHRTTQEDGPDFIEPMDRIAVFDNDGTLWVEQPFYTQMRFGLDSLQAQAADHPEWRDDPLMVAALQEDIEALASFGLPGVAKIVAATHTGMTTEELASQVRTWTETARHPRFDRRYVDLIYQPQLQLMQFLRAHGYRGLYRIGRRG